MKTRIQISLDDTKGIFKYLASHKESCSNIFETRMLSFLKELHEKYKTEFTLYCVYKDEEFNLGQVPDQYRSQFQEAAEWLHFGFHAFDEVDAVTGEEMKAAYQKVQKEIERITGTKRLADVVRLHRFEGNRQTCRILHELGVKAFLTADDERDSYYLSHAEKEILKETGCYRDEKEEILFYSSLTRLEHCGDIREEIERVCQKKWEYIAVFTHEWQMDRDDIREKMEKCCKFSLEKRAGELEGIWKSE